MAFKLETPFELSSLDYIRSIPGHMWIAATGVNVIRLDYLPRLESKFTINWTDEAKKAYEEYNNRPDYIVKLSFKKDRIEILENKKQRTGMFTNNHIPSLSFDYRSTYKIALTDAHYLPEIQHNYKVEYSDEAKALVESQLARRKALLEIVTAKSYDGFNDLVLHPLKDDQKVALRFAELLNGRSIIAYDVGKGKSAIGIAESKRLSKVLGRPCKTLIVAPAQLKTNWLREIRKFTGEDAYILAGATPDSISVDLLFKGTLNYYIINYDIIGRSQKDSSGDKILLWPKFINLANFDLIVYDEIHYAKNIDSQRSQGARELKAKYTMCLSGTLITNRPTDAYPPLNIVAPDTFNNYSYFISTHLWNDGKTVRDEKAFRELLSNYMIRRLRDPVEIERITNYIELDNVQRAYYNKVLEGVYISLSNPDYMRDVNSVLAEITRLKQICSTACVDTSAELAKNFIADSEEGKDKVIIFSQYIDSCHELHKILGSNALLMTGEVSNKQRYEMVDKFQNDPEVKVLIASTKSSSEGLTLTKAHCVIFNDLMWTPASHIQAEGRAFGRINDPHGGIVYTVVAQNTVMQMIQEILETKRNLIDNTVDNVHRESLANASIVSEFLSKLRGIR